MSLEYLHFDSYGYNRNCKNIMTVTYSLEVSRTKLGGFAKLLLRWRGSIYRLVYREMIIFTLLYYSMAILYRYVLPERHKRAFEEVARYCREFTDLIPITFVMGFYVAVVVGRWWQQYLAIPWPDRCCFQIAAFVQGNDERGRLIRRALARYLNILAVLTMQAISTVVKKRFPTMEHFVQAGLMTEEERIELESVEAPHGNWWVPASWFCQLAMQARKEGRIHDDLHLKSLIDDAMSFRGNCGLMWSFDWISVPLVYTQVVTLAVYCFFAACLFGRQHLEQVSVDGQTSFMVDHYIPIFTFFQFFFYMGWLKVAEQLINPYGEDDDDFELSWIIDRNLQVSYVTVDAMHQRYPKLTRDLFWDNVQPELPYTEGAMNFKTDPFLGSTMTMNIPNREKGWHIKPIPEERKESENFANLKNSTDQLDQIEEIGTAPESPRSVDGDRETRRNSKSPGSIPFRHYTPPRPFGRPKFLNSLVKGASRSAFSSQCGSRTSINSTNNTGGGVLWTQKSPPTGPAECDQVAFSNWHIHAERQWSVPDGAQLYAVHEHAGLTMDTNGEKTNAAPIVVPDPAPLVQVDSPMQTNRRVTFDHEPEEAPLTDSDGTLLSETSADTDPPYASDSEQLTIHSRTLLLQTIP